MKIIYKLLSILCILSLIPSLYASENPLHPHDYFPESPIRANSAEQFDPSLAPFYHGVASGDPLQDRVMIWTRVTTENAGTARVNYHVYRDIELRDKVTWGWVDTDESRDYTVKVDVDGLEPNTTYYYAFEYDGVWSITGRTRTLPETADEVKLAVISCVNYQWGYFNALERISERADLNAVVHLGDYFYEYPGGDYSHPDLENEREHEPNSETVQLADYRVRFSQYRLDPMLRKLHQQHPMIAVWDDHESTNDSWSTGASNHSENEGSWEVRKDNSAKAYSEWMPIRLPRANDKAIYRSFDFGGLLDLYMLETRLSARDEPIGAKGEAGGEIDTLDWQREDRTMLGQEQKEWLTSSLATSDATWKIVGSSIMMVNLPVNLLTNFDAWDGYPAERRQIFDAVRAAGVENFGVLSGDFHMSFAHNLMDDREVYKNMYDSTGAAGSVGFEFTTPSVTSANLNELSEFEFGTQTFDPLGDRLAERSFLATFVENLAKGQVPWMNLFNSDQHGYMLIYANQNFIQSDWWYMDDILEPDNGQSKGVSIRVDSGNKTLYIVDEAIPLLPASELAPQDITVNVEYEKRSNEDFLLIGNYPNPASDLTYINIAVNKPVDLLVKVSDVSGRLLFNQEFQSLTAGILNIPLDLSSLSEGNYIYSVSMEGKSYSRNLIVRR